MLVRVLNIFGMVSLAVVCCGCGSTTKSASKPPKIFRVSMRQVAPDPNYNRLGWGQPEDPIITVKVTDEQKPYINPVFHLDLKNATLEETARILGSMAKYSAYCSSLLAESKITINSLGTLDELASEISRNAGINAVVDHENREVRFLSGNAEFVAPKFYQE